ncbi:unnamed protein product [Orchesella dallaii]|uniref:Uncharacterized protein n=1 Tax=Orchesella dallaii TaxID=48710 RepID=A0ABP1SAP5_9HEXA
MTVLSPGIIPMHGRHAKALIGPMTQNPKQWITEDPWMQKGRKEENNHVQYASLPHSYLVITCRQRARFSTVREPESAGTDSEGDEAGELSSERELNDPNGKPVRRRHKQEKSDDEEGLLQNSRQQLPLNLTGKYEQFGLESGGQQQCLLGTKSSVLTSCLSVQPAGNNSSIEPGRLKLQDKGPKVHLLLSAELYIGSCSPNISRQVSPPLFSVSSSSPFSAIFPTASGNPVSNYSYMLIITLASIASLHNLI